MNHPIDELFRKNLSDYEMQPPADMWERLQVYKNNKKSLLINRWLGIAASFLVIMASIYVVQMNGNEEGEQTIQIAAISPVGQIAVVPEIPEPKITGNNPEQDKTHTSTVTVIKKDVNDAVKIIDSEKGKDRNHAPTIIEVPESITRMALTMTKPVEPSVSIAKVEIENKREEETTLLERITNTARDIKNSEGMMAELREFKNEVVSLEFFKTKKSI